MASWRWRIPQDGIIGEEQPASGPAGASISWVIDPIDGTCNFINGVPLYACSIGVLHEGWPVAGCDLVCVDTMPSARASITRTSAVRCVSMDVPSNAASPAAGAVSPLSMVGHPAMPRIGTAGYSAPPPSNSPGWPAGCCGWRICLGRDYGTRQRVSPCCMPRGCSALTWEHGRWAPLLRFMPPAGSQAESQLAAWQQPVLIGAAADLAAALKQPRAD